MKSLMAFFGILAFNFTTSAHASDFSCPVSTAVASYTCSGTVKVTTLAELNAYKADLGVVAKKPTIAKNLQIAFNPSLITDLTISTPCSIKIPANTIMNSTANICLNGSKGVSIDDGLQFTGKNLKLESKEEVIIDKNSTINASDIKLLSIGSGDTSKAYIRDGAHIRAANLSIESFDKGFVGRDSNIVLTGTLGIYTLGDDEASIRQGARVEAQKIEVSSTNVTRVANLANLVAHQIILNGQTCEINKGATITSTDRLGNCFLTSLTKAKFSIDKTQGSTPLTINFNASTIADAKGFIWSFGDGETVNSLTPTISHVYSRVGSYTATMQYATKDNYKGLKSAGGVQVDVKAAVVVPPTTPPRGTFNYAQDGTFVYLKSFIKRTQFDIATAYYVFDDNQNNKLYMSNFYQNSQSSIDLNTFGAHKITMYVEDVQGQKYNTTMYIDLKQSEDNIAPFVRFYGEQSAVRTAFINMVYSFIPVQDEFLDNFTVEFGDGQTATVEGATSIVHTYAQAGTYNVKVSAGYNGNVRSSTVAITVTDTNKPALNPVAGFDYHILDFAGNVTFADDRSGTANGEIISYEWNFGDGQGLVYGEYAAHFFAPGDYLVSLTVTDTAGLRSTQTQKIHIATPGDDLVASLQCWKEGDKLLKCDIFALDKTNQITRVKVQWGDGASQIFTEAEIVEWGLFFGEHQYQNYGTYTAKLTVNTSRGQTEYSYFSQTFLENHPVLPPVANINCTVSNLLVNCNALGSYDPKGGTLTFKFNYQDGFSETNTVGLSSHSLSQEGLSQVTVTVTDSMGLSQVAQTLVEIIFLRPIANLHCSTNNLIAYCNALGSSDPINKGLTYEFNYSDGFIEINYNGISSHAFASPGLYFVSVKVSDYLGNSAIVSTQVQPLLPPNQLPFANVSCYSNTPNTLICNSNASGDADGSIISFKYDWDDNTSETHASSDEIFHIFSNGGPHQVTLTVIDNDGGVKSITNSFEVKINNPPIASFECKTYEPQKINCYSTSYDADLGDNVIQFDWGFGDGKSQTGLAGGFDHLYQDSSTYEISLTVYDQHGAHATLKKMIKLLENQAPSVFAECNLSNGTSYNCVASANDSDGTIADSFWIIDGYRINNTSTLYDFKNGGDYIATFTAIDNLGKKTSVETSIFLDQAIANFECELTTILSIKCDASNTVLNNPDQTVSYRFEFDQDGIVGDKFAEHEFSTFGTHTVKLVVISQDGKKSEINKQYSFVRSYLAPLADFTMDIDLLFNASFDGSSSGFQDRNVVKYIWSFGDGVIIETTVPRVNHHFSTEGYYDVSLVVYDELGNTNTKLEKIYIYNSEVPKVSIENDQNLAGIDSDNDGVRDDVQLWILSETSDEPDIKTVLKKYARNLNSKLINASDANIARALQKEGEYMELCLEYKINNPDRYGYIYNFLQMITLNTNDRNMAFIKYNSSINGTSSEVLSDNLDKSQYCSKF